MRFLIDAQLPPALAKWRAAKGHEAVTARDSGLRDAADPAIWSKAIADSAIIVTKDEDFALMAAADQAGPTVLWVRTGNLVNRLLLTSFERAWPEIVQHLESGVKVVELR
jgi:predicted nuclease of predicted toxin-antitoxin system